MISYITLVISWQFSHVYIYTDNFLHFAHTFLYINYFKLLISHYTHDYGSLNILKSQYTIYFCGKYNMPLTCEENLGINALQTIMYIHSLKQLQYYSLTFDLHGKLAQPLA